MHLPIDDRRYVLLEDTATGQPRPAELVIRSTGTGLFIARAGHAISAHRSVYHGAGLSITVARSVYYGCRSLSLPVADTPKTRHRLAVIL